MTEQDIAAQLDAARAEVDRLQEAFETSAVYTAHLQVTRQDALAEVSKLQAEVAKLRACLPKWRKVPWIENRWELHLVDKHNVVCVNSRGWWHRHQSEHTPEYESRDAAMRAAEAWLGVPQCEVVE